MRDRAEAKLGDRIRALRDPRSDADWLDVRRRARRRGIGRFAAVAAAAALAVAVAAPALGLHRTVVDWFAAEPAPERVQVQFSQLGVGAPKGMDPGVIPNSARRVTTAHHDGKEHVLWVAPTREGGFCWLWTELSGGCHDSAVSPPPPAQVSPDVRPFLLGVTWMPDDSGVMQLFTGRLLAHGTERLVAEFADGRRGEIPVVWVSPPIDAGFYFYAVPEEHRRPGRHLSAIVAEGRDREVLARQTFRLTAPADVEQAMRLPDGQMVRLPARALPEQARRLIDFRAENGQRVALWLIPTEDGRHCFHHNRGGGCPPGELDMPMASALLPGARPVLFSAQVRADVAAVELRYENGASERLVPVEGFLLHEIGSAHYERGSRLEAAVALTTDGRVLVRHPFDPTSPGTYPCDEPVDHGHGVMLCP